MKEIQYIMNTMTKDSFVIIDELGRSTSVDEGSAIAMTIVEQFALTPTYLFMTTHYTTITRLYNIYPNIML